VAGVQDVVEEVARYAMAADVVVADGAYCAKMTSALKQML